MTSGQPWVKDLPPHYVEKLSGPIDGFSCQLMQESGEMAEFDKANEARKG